VEVKEKLKALLAEYGPIAIVIYFVIFLAVYLSFYISITGGFQPEGVGETAGTFGAAWLATKLTQPLRILATLVLTPLVGGLIKRYRRTPLDEAVAAEVEADSDADDADAEEEA
jgi:hypothetical protein